MVLAVRAFDQGCVSETGTTPVDSEFTFLCLVHRDGGSSVGLSMGAWSMDSWAHRSTQTDVVGGWHAQSGACDDDDEDDDEDDDDEDDEDDDDDDDDARYWLTASMTLMHLQWCVQSFQLIVVPPPSLVGTL